MLHLEASNKKIYLFVLALFFLISVPVLSQVVYEPLYKDVYNYLRRISQRGVLEFHDEIRPLSRKYIAEKLLEAEKNSDLLTELEKDELKFFKQDYYHEFWFTEEMRDTTTHLDYFSKDPAGRWRFFTYGSNAFRINAGLILGAEVGSLDKAKRTHFWNGIYTYGYITNLIGFSFDFRDNTENGTTLDKNKIFTPVTGVNERSDQNIVDYSPDKIEYSEAKGILATDWKWGSIAVGKEFMEWGYAENGLIVLSQKAPSFPFIRFDVYPVDWFGFNYFHAWLSSDVIDSSSIYYSNTGSTTFKFREKYLASHTISLRPTKGLDILLGESIVYSDKLEILYLIPVMFYRLADHYLSRQINGAGGNAQLFASVSSRGHIKNTHLYGTIFIDEFTVNGMLDSEKQRNQLGFTLGGSVTDFPLNNLTLKLEYSKLFPFVYDHLSLATNYTSASYLMGHWMGNNADQVYASVKYRFIRGLEAMLWGRYIRQGEKGNPEDQYLQPQPPFLFGLRTNHTYFGGYIKYEFLHELFVRFRYQYTKTSTQQEDLSFIDDSIQEFVFAVYYGL